MGLMRSPHASVRPASEDDLERLIDLHTSAFPDPRGRYARAGNFTRNALGHLSDLHVLVEGDALLAHAFLFPLQAWVGGALVPVGGVATVGVAPEARGRGIASVLLQHLHELARARGDVATLLYPFRQGFYGRIGYAPTSSYRRLRFHPAAVPWSTELPARAASGKDRPALVACRDAAARARTGVLARTERAWDARLADEQRTWLVVEGSTGVEGYVAWTIEQPEAHAAATLVVVEMAAGTAAAARSLWGLVGAQRDQVAAVFADVAADDPIDRALVDADRAHFGDAAVEHAVGELVTGPMVRVLDASRALEARGWPVDGALVLRVDDVTLALTARDGRATVVPTAPAAEPDVRMDARTLAAVALGALGPRDAARLGWLTARDDAALARAGALLDLPPYFSSDPF